MDSFMMGSSAGCAVYYCCVFDGKKKNYCHNSGDNQLESFADLCLENAPPFHSWYFHTTRGRTYGFLMENEFTYFVIANSGIGSQELLKLLKYVRDGYRKSSKSEFLQDLIPVVKQLIASLENVPRSDFFDQMMTDGDRPSPSEGPKIPLLGNKHDRKKMKEMASDGSDDENHFDRIVNVGIRPEPTGAFRLQKSPSPNRVWSQQTARMLWLRQVKIIVVVDVLLCLILFFIWLMICRGFKCVSSG